MKRNPLLYFIVPLLAVIALLMLFTFQVRKSEVVVVTTFGRPTREVTEPGWNLRLPWGIQMVHRFDQRVQNFEEKPTEGLTRDSVNLITSTYVGWKITEATNFFPKFGSDNPIGEAEKVLERLAGSARSAVVGKHPLTDFVSASDNGSHFIAIENEILSALESQVKANNYGLQIEFLGLKKIGIPENVTQQVFDQMTKERQVLVSKSQAEGEAEASKIKSEADRAAAEMNAAAEGQATQIRGLGEAKAAESLKVFEQNPELANLFFSLSALEGSLKERSILVFDRRTPPFNIMLGVSTNLLNPGK